MNIYTINSDLKTNKHFKWILNNIPKQCSGENVLSQPPNHTKPKEQGIRESNSKEKKKCRSEDSVRVMGSIRKLINLMIQNGFNPLSLMSNYSKSNSR